MPTAALVPITSAESLQAIPGTCLPCTYPRALLDLFRAALAAPAPQLWQACGVQLHQMCECLVHRHAPHQVLWCAAMTQTDSQVSEFDTFVRQLQVDVKRFERRVRPISSAADAYLGPQVHHCTIQASHLALIPVSSSICAAQACT